MEYDGVKTIERGGNTVSDPTPGRNWAGIAAAVLALFVVLNVVSYLWFPFLPWFEQREAGKEIVREQMDADKALENYRWFRQQYNDIEAQRAQVQHAYDAEAQFHETYGDNPDEWSRTAEVRHGRLHERITGNQNILEEMVADYNARSDDATRAIWKCSLPYEVDERFAIAGPPGSGAPDQPQDKYVEGANPNAEPPEAEQCDALPSQAQANAVVA